MRNVMRQGLLAVIVGIGLTACDGGKPPRPPLAPSPAPPPAPAPAPTSVTITVNGFVEDTAFRPLLGARVEALDNAQVERSTTAGADGVFRLAGTFDSSTSFRATLAGYVSATQTWTQCPTCPQPYLAFRLAPPTAPVAVAGEYNVTFIADVACTGIPADLQTRTYTATMTPTAPSPNIPADTSFKLTLHDGEFLPDYDSIYVGVAGDVVTMLFGGHGPYLVEQMATNRYLGYDGAVGVVTTSPLRTIDASFDGWVNYCALNAPMGRYYDCPLGRAVTRSECRAPNHRLIVTRR